MYYVHNVETKAITEFQLFDEVKSFISKQEPDKPFDVDSDKDTEGWENKVWWIFVDPVGGQGGTYFVTNEKEILDEYLADIGQE